jgi:hypothetical protein
MIDRVDLLIAVMGIVVSILGSSTAIWMALSKKADRADLARLESRLETRMDRFEGRLERFEDRLDRVEGKIDSLITQLLPDTRP